MPHTFRTLMAALLVVVLAPALQAQPKPKPLEPADVKAIAQLLMLEDTRSFDEAALTRLIASAHPEIRRRAVMAIARIANPAGRTLLASARADADPDVAATVAFATGQLKDAKDAEGVAWLSRILAASSTPPAVAREAARALGKIRSPEARVALAQYLAAAPIDSKNAPIAGEALLSIGRFTGKEDIAPIVRWIAASDEGVRWRAAWALFRPRDPAAVPHLLTMTGDRSAQVRFWAVRGLAPTLVTAAGLDMSKTAARLREAVKDPDRQVRTEALRALAQYDDDASFGVVLAALDSPDTWLSVSAAEGLARFQSRADVVVPRLTTAAGPGRPTALRITALNSLVALTPQSTVDVAAALVRDSSLVARMAAVQALQKAGDPGKARLEALAADPATKELIPPSGRGRGQRPPPAARPEADYHRIAERWVVPAYNGAPKPRAILGTPHGDVELELYPAEAPLGLDFFISVVESGAIVGTEFGRVVPNFVAQQRAIRDDVTLRDEVSRLGLTRGNLSWASAGLDTGRPGYTLGVTAQPHNEGDFTALGRVTRGMEAVERLELGDRITSARIVK